MVVVDKIMNDGNFIPIKMVHKEANIVEIYMKEISRLNGVPEEIVSDRDTKFTSNFWKGLQGIWDKYEFQHNLSSKIRWADQEGQPNN
jgi:hypothetical protein